MSKFFERLRMFVSIFLPHEAIKFFPPDFTIRDPFYTKIEQTLKKNDLVSILIFDIKDFRIWMASYDDATIHRVLKMVEKSIKKWFPLCFAREDLIVVKRFWGDTILAAVRYSNNTDFEVIREKGEDLRKRITDDVNAKLSDWLNREIHFHYGYAPVSPETQNIRDAVTQAWYLAHAIAKKRIAPHYHKLKDELNQIIQSGNIKVQAQPIVSLNGGGLEGYEILTRGPENTIYANPSQLFDIASQAGLLLQLELLVFYKAIQEIKNHHISCPVFINITASTLQQPEYLMQIGQLLQNHQDVDPHLIIFEITERESIEDLETFKSFIEKYRKLGFRFAIDDTGSGYSSLKMITEINPEVIKIDRSVITDIDKALVKESMLFALLHIAKNINAKVVAEGIERPEELLLLLKHKVEWGQGYLFSQPLDLSVKQ